MCKNDKVIRRYSEHFKLKILAELSIGKHTKNQLYKRYSIAPTTVNVWIKENHCYKNTMAERVNGILKDEFYLDQNFTNVVQAKRAIKHQIWYIN